MPDIAVFCASQQGLPAPFRQAATDLGHRLADRGWPLVFGGGDVGLMGECARAVHEKGGYVAGYIPRALHSLEGRAYALSNELVVTETMDERKTAIFARADAFVILPGGFGTLEEFLEIVTLRYLGYYDKPIVLLNTAGYFDTLLAFFREAGDLGFITEDNWHFTIAEDPEAALRSIETDLT